MPTGRPTRHELLQAALRYPSDFGWAVIPLHSIDKRGVCTCSQGEACPSPGKHPRVLKGLKSASTRPSQIRQWWARWPDANIGVVTGAASGIVVVDVDADKGGLDSLRQLEAAHGEAPPTPTARTGNGLHLYFKHPGGDVPNRAGLAKGIDLRGDGGYVVAPPSWHRSGRRYEWNDGRDPRAVAPAPLPTLPEKRPAPPRQDAAPPGAPPPRPAAGARQEPYVTAAWERELGAVARAPRGERNRTLNRAAFALAGFVASGHLDEGAVRTALMAAASDLVATDGEKSVVATIDSGMKAGLQQPRDVPRREAAPAAVAGATSPSWDVQPAVAAGAPSGSGNGLGGHANGHTNGHANGHTAPPIFDADGVVLDEHDPGDFIDELNRDFALILHGGRAVVMREIPGPDGHLRMDLVTVAGFRQYFANQRTATSDGKMVPKADLWLKHKRRRSFIGVTFAPEGGDPRLYNLWRGFTVLPKPGDCSAFTNHVLEVICSGDEHLYHFVMSWMAQIVQQPGRKPGTSIALRGGMGAGKTVVGEILGSLLGQHHTLVAHPDAIVGRFNAHLESCVLLQADEAFWAGDKKALGVLRDLVTRPTMRIERKGMETMLVRNTMRLLVTSNERWVVPAGMDERRFAVIDVGDQHKQERAYFSRLRAVDRAALLHYLLHYDISDEAYLQIPRTSALFEQKIKSAPHEHRWWHAILQQGEIAADHEWPREIRVGDLYSNYLGWTERHRVWEPLSQPELGRELRALMPTLKRSRPRTGWADAGRPWIYELPALDDARRSFAAAYGDPDFAWDAVQDDSEDQPQG